MEQQTTLNHLSEAAEQLIEAMMELDKFNKLNGPGDTVYVEIPQIGNLIQHKINEQEQVL